MWEETEKHLMSTRSHLNDNKVIRHNDVKFKRYHSIRAIERRFVWDYVQVLGCSQDLLKIIGKGRREPFARK